MFPMDGEMKKGGWLAWGDMSPTAGLPPPQPPTWGLPPPKQDKGMYRFSKWYKFLREGLEPKAGAGSGQVCLK